MGVSLAMLPFLVFFLRAAAEYHARTRPLMRALNRDIRAMGGSRALVGPDDGAGLLAGSRAIRDAAVPPRQTPPRPAA